MVEVFNFKNSDFVITISREAFRDNIQNVYNFYLQSEKYELCGRVKHVEMLLDNAVNPKKPNEKE